MNKMTIILFLIFMFICKSVAFSETWQQTLEQHFDIVDTFDHYQDWQGYDGIQGDECISDVNDLPKFDDNSKGIWDMYCHANNETPFGYGLWITDHGSGKQVGSKSLKLSTQGANPTTVKKYVGNGSPNSGYSEVYVFFRLFLPRNTFPTYIVQPAGGGGIMGYKAGDPFLYLTSWKFFNIGTGFNDVYSWNDQGYQVYGDTEVWFHLNTYASRDAYKNMLDLRTFYSKRTEVSTGFLTIDELGGIEFHVKLGSLAGHDGTYKNDGLVEVWWYDKNGNVVKIMEKNDMSFRPSSGDGHLINRLWINGNKHDYDSIQGGATGEYYCGTGMNCVMYVDDFIVDDQRVGLKYFEMLNSPSAPSSGSVSSRSESSVKISWSANTESDIDHYVVYWGESSRNDTGGTYPSNSANIDKSQTSYTINGLIEGQTYFFAVKAADKLGQESDYSQEFATLCISLPQNGIFINTKNYKSYTISGFSRASANVEVLAEGISVGTATADEGGRWNLQVDFSTFSDGPVSLTVKSNGLTSGAITGTIDRTAPSAPQTK